MAKTSQRIEREIHRTKIVVRHLPNRLTEVEFRDLIEPCPKYDYFRFAPSDATHGALGFSRAYINFVNEDDVVPFCERFDGYVFEDGFGAKSCAVVEFSPFQRIPRKTKRKPDVKCGTLESDVDYNAHCAFLKEDVAPLPSIDKTLYLLADQKSQVKSTNLIDYLIDQKERKEKILFHKHNKKERFDRRPKDSSRPRRDKGRYDVTGSKTIMKAGQAHESKAESKPSRPTASHPPVAVAQPKHRSVSNDKSNHTGSVSQTEAPSRPKQTSSHEQASVRIIERPRAGQKRGELQTSRTHPITSSNSTTSTTTTSSSSSDAGLKAATRSALNDQSSSAPDQKSKRVVSSSSTTGGHRNRERPERAIYVPKSRPDHSKWDRKEGEALSSRHSEQYSSNKGEGHYSSRHKDDYSEPSYRQKDGYSGSRNSSGHSTKHLDDSCKSGGRGSSSRYQGDRHSSKQSDSSRQGQEDGSSSYRGRGRGRPYSSRARGGGRGRGGRGGGGYSGQERGRSYHGE